MNYRPDPEKLRLWDTWVFVDGEDVHLFFLASLPGRPWDRIGHAVSRDWLHWTELPNIDLRSMAGLWAGDSFGTGMVFRHGGRYYMTYTGGLGANEAIGLLVSDDVVHWRSAHDGPVWPRSEALPYELAAHRCADAAAWRDAYVARNPEDQLEAFCCARVDEGPPAGRACIARARLESPDRWVTLPPIGEVGLYAAMEVPEVFRFEDRFWATFSTTSSWGIRIDTPERSMASGTFFLSSESWDGPYDAPTENLLLGAGSGRLDGYVARTVAHKDQRLTYHHFAGDPPAFGLPKALVRDGARLRLAPWEGLSALRTGEARLEPWESYTRGPGVPGVWRIVNRVVYGECGWGAAAAVSRPGAPDIDLTIGVLIEEGEFAGVAVGLDADAREGVLFGMDALRNEITVRRFHGWAPACGPDLSRILDTVRRDVRRGMPYKLRIIRRDRFAELYIDDRWVFSTVLDGPAQGGGVACVVETATARFRILEAYALEPL